MEVKSAQQTHTKTTVMVAPNFIQNAYSNLMEKRRARIQKKKTNDGRIYVEFISRNLIKIKCAVIYL